MPAWNDYKAEAKSRGALALELFVVHSVPTAEPEVLKANLPAHLAYQGEQEAKGNLVLAGPVSDETGELMQGMGMIIYRAESLAAATELAENDPMHKAGARSFSIRKWLVNEGSLNVSIGLSGKTVSLS